MYVFQTSFCFKQLPLNTRQKCESQCQLIDEEILSSIVVGVVIFSADNVLEFHETIFYRLVFLKYNKAVEVLSKVVLHHCKSSFDQ